MRRLPDQPYFIDVALINCLHGLPRLCVGEGTLVSHGVNLDNCGGVRKCHSDAAVVAVTARYLR